ncbi:MAG: formate dehydrogenase accessory sulfurtransferase FdhD [Nitrospirae bacterium]|nr:formate dehydrogenase accessory sulfurtransferase FdhD [Nitrospirota bacterium]
MDPYIKRNTLIRHGTSFEEIEDYIAIEKKLIVSVNGKEVISLYCTPLMIKELVTGFFLTEGIFTDKFLMDKMKIVYGKEVMIDIPVDKDIFKEGMVPSRFQTEKKFLYLQKILGDIM